MHGEGFSHVLFPGLDGEFVNADVKELDGAVTGGDEDLVLVRFGPGEVEEGVLGVEPADRVSFGVGGEGLSHMEGDGWIDTISQQRCPWASIRGYISVHCQRDQSTGRRPRRFESQRMGST